ncbi:MAG: hypothetical protein KAT12_08110, partial [Gammaproteobacteria bacterium]|nr:hypothetical protein [Gammaproteobacteria bacterium]
MKGINRTIVLVLLSISTNLYSAEIIPLLGFRAGGEFIDQATNKKHVLESSESYGLILSFPYERGKNIE